MRKLQPPAAAPVGFAAGDRQEGDQKWPRSGDFFYPYVLFEYYLINYLIN